MACMGQCTWVWSESMGSWMPGYYNTCESGCICGPAPGQEGPYDGYVATVACESTGGTTTTTTTTPSACASSQCCWLAVRIETGGGSGYMAWAPSSFCPNGCECSINFPPYNGTDPAPGDVYCAPCAEATTTTTSTTAGSTTTTTTTAGSTTTTTTPVTCSGVCTYVWDGRNWSVSNSTCASEVCFCPVSTDVPGTYVGQTYSEACSTVNSLCASTCTWIWSGTGWSVLSSDCVSPCACSYMPTFDGEYTGQEIQTWCVSPTTTTSSTTSSTTTSTTTTPLCDTGYCLYAWAGDRWFVFYNSCGENCFCGPEPSRPGAYFNEQVFAACQSTPTTTSTSTTTTSTTSTAPPTTTTTTATAGTNYTLNANSSVTFILNGISTSSAPDYVLRAGGSGTFILNGIPTNTTTTTTTSTEGPLGPNSYNCFSDHNNPTGDVPPPDYKVYLCDWKGTPPQTFSGTWYCTNGSPSVCPTYPTTPTAVTFTRQPCTLIYLAPEDSIVPFRMGIPDPMLPSWADANAQALAIGLTGFLPAHPTGTPSPACTCGTGTIFLSYEFTVELCHFHIEITAVTF